MALPMTVEVRRETHPDRSSEAIDWVERGLALARGFDGYLGGGLLRDAEQGNVLHTVYCFCDAEALRRWEHSPERRSWLSSGQTLVAAERIQRRTGIEGWFDGPTPRAVPTARVADNPTGQRMIGVRSAPQRWKQMCAIWIGMYPLNLLTSWLLTMAPWWSDTPLPLRSALMVGVLAPLMTFAVMPMVTRVLRPWLRRNPGIIRSERALREALDTLPDARPRSR